MKFEIKKLIATFGACATLLLAPIAQAVAGPVNLVTNPSFEDGNLVWTFNDNVTKSDAKAYDGIKSMHLVPDEFKGGAAEQSINLDVNSSYSLDFYVFGEGKDFFEDLIVMLDGETISDFGKVEVANSEWTHFSKTIINNSGGALIFALNGPGNLFLDLVSVTCQSGLACIESSVDVPEPSSFFLIGAALAAGAMFRRKKHA